ncbi:MAG: glycosyltransferase [Prevotellaceae bacterium]|jgi:glycosyltransferase involved in cell wall biosynthesis|nr:glycosyltransferase [Prevotellaceae bacterium]
MKHKKVTIICVTKNAAAYLNACLKSIEEQSTNDYEIIIQDGGSTDGTLDVINQWNDKIAYWVSAPDNGIYDAMNKAISHASGDWIYFIGADDRLFPEFAEMVEHDLTDPRTIYYANVLLKGNKYLGKFSAYKLAKHNICHQAMFYPREVFQYYQFDLAYHVYADHVLNIHLFGDSRFSFKYKDKLIAFFNDAGYSSVQKDLNFQANQKKLILKHLGIWAYLRFLNRERKEKK